MQQVHAQVTWSHSCSCESPLACYGKLLPALVLLEPDPVGSSFLGFALWVSQEQLCPHPHGSSGESVEYRVEACLRILSLFAPHVEEAHSYLKYRL